MAPFRPLNNLIAFLIAAFLADSVSAYTLTVLHTNDVHAAYSGFTAKKSVCYETHCAKGSGGFIRLKRTVDALRRNHDNVLVFDAGDQFQGSLFSTLFGARASWRLMQEIGYDAATLGNHEFDRKKTLVEAYLQHLPGKIVCANVEGIQGLPAWKVIERQGQKIGIVGLITPETAFLDDPGPGIRFTDPKQSLTKAVNDLKRQGVRTIIVLSHLGLDVDRKLAQEVQGVCLWVSAHTHSLLGNRADTDGPYPIFEKDSAGRRVALVSTGSSGKYLGVLQLQVDEDGQLTAATGDTQELNDTLLETLEAPAIDRQSKAAYDTFWNEVQKEVGQKIGRIEGSRFSTLDDGDPNRCRKAGCELGEVITDSLRQATGAQIALLNSGVIRASFPNDTLYECHVKAALPFGNTLAYIASLRGSVILQMLEHGLANYGPGKGSGRFLQTAGLSYTFNPAKPAGERLVEVLVHSKGSTSPLRADAYYSVATIDYLMGGGDGYDFLKDVEFHALKRHKVDTILKHHFQRYGTVKIVHRDIASPIYPEGKSYAPR